MCRRPECSYLHFLYAGLALGSVAQARACILHLLTALVQLMEDNDDSHLPVPVPALALINAQDTTLALAAYEHSQCLLTSRTFTSADFYD